MQKEQKDRMPVGVEILLDKPDSFLLIKETLTRIGIASKKSKTLFQSCHILHKQGRYSVVHFKELFALDRKETDITEDDYRRRNTIARLLDHWKLCKILNKSDVEFVLDSDESMDIKIVPFKEKKDWDLIAKYAIGNRSKRICSDNVANTQMP